jgi:hypothetical protein
MFVNAGAVVWELEGGDLWRIDPNSKKAIGSSSKVPYAFCDILDLSVECKNVHWKESVVFPG